jgi:hypothetical protein
MTRGNEGWLRIAGIALIGLGAFVLLLFAENLYSRWARETKGEVLRESFLRRLLLPDAYLGKAPTPEGVERWSQRNEVGGFCIRWIVPSLGIAFGVAGLLVVIAGSRRGGG